MNNANATHLIEDNETVLAVARPFAQSIAGRPLNFNATGKAEENAQAQALGDARKQFPYPPKSCDDAMTTIANIQAAITKANTQIADGTSNRVAKRYLTAYQTVLNEFQTYVNAAKCVQTALNTENDAFNNQLQTALATETATSNKKTTNNNVLIFSALGILLVGTVIIILKKSKA